MSAAVLVTGAAGTIGRTILQALEASGQEVFGTDAREPEGRNPWIRASLPEEAQLLADSLPASLGGIVHAIGRIETHDAMSWSDEEFHSLFLANVLAPLRLTLLLADRLEHGSPIVFVGSVAGLRPTPNNLLYGATKAALHHAAMTLSVSLAPRGLRVNVVAPGLIEGPLTDATNHSLSALTGQNADEVARARIQAIPMRRIGTAEDIAATVAFMMSQEAGFMSGAVVPVTGGGHL